jgi:hypothetical protein
MTPCPEDELVRLLGADVVAEGVERGWVAGSNFEDLFRHCATEGCREVPVWFDVYGVPWCTHHKEVNSKSKRKK